MCMAIRTLQTTITIVIVAQFQITKRWQRMNQSNSHQKNQELVNRKHCMMKKPKGFREADRIARIDSQATIIPRERVQYI